MERNVLIFHGTGGHPQENWFPWLKEQLELRGCKVYIPHFPHPQDHPLPDWLAVLEKYKQHINKDSILIGHSLGGLFLFRVLERTDYPIYAAFFVAAPVGIKPIKFYDSDLAFSGFEFDWIKIKNKAKNFRVYHSNNDPYISIKNGEEVARRLGIKLTFIPNAGHFNSDSGFRTFDVLLRDIENIL